MLTTALVSARTTLELFNNKAKTPLFVVSIPKGKDKKTVTKEMVEIQNLAKKEVKDHIKILTGIIASTTKSPQYLKSKLDMISRKVGDMCTMFKNLYHKNYKDLISKVEPTNNEKNIQLIEEFLSELIKYRSAFYAIIDYINEERRSNRLKLKKRSQRNSSLSNKG
ncbi:hypothetical protein BASA83_006018 [Batrachochytrium salamandrivorans]|nr:hypothetical protein BASA83_006018 [Batrachochytrium salamandrivorans]